MELSGDGQLGVRERVCTRGRWAWNGLPRAVGTALRLAEFKKGLDSIFRRMV